MLFYVIISDKFKILQDDIKKRKLACMLLLEEHNKNDFKVKSRNLELFNTEEWNRVKEQGLLVHLGDPKIINRFFELYRLINDFNLIKSEGSVIFPDFDNRLFEKLIPLIKEYLECVINDKNTAKVHKTLINTTYEKIVKEFHES